VLKRNSRKTKRINLFQKSEKFGANWISRRAKRSGKGAEQHRKGKAGQMVKEYLGGTPFKWGRELEQRGGGGLRRRWEVDKSK